MRKIKLFSLLAGLLLSVGTMFADGNSCGGGLTWGYDSQTKTLTISYDGEGTGVMDDYTSIFSVPWYGKDLWHVSLPTGLKHIGDLAFSQHNMSSITIPEGVESIGKQAFRLCGSLTSVSLPNSLRTIDEEAFSNSYIPSIVIPEGVTTICKGCFLQCTQLESITLPSTLLTIGENAFQRCFKLKSLTVPANVNNIGKWIFEDCNKIESIVVDPNNTTYDSRDNCNAIIKTSTNTIIAGCKNSDIPASVKSIQYQAFSLLNMGGRNIVIPEGVTTLEESCFSCCTNASISVPSTTTSIGGILVNPPFNGSSFSSIVVAANNPNFDSRNNCNAIIKTSTNTLVQGSLSTVIPEDITKIGGAAFDGMKGLTSITIPASVQSLGFVALACEDLTEIICHATTPPTVSGTMVFDHVNKDIPVYIPEGTKAAYQAANGWKDFTNFIDPAESEPEPEPQPEHHYAWTSGSCTITLDNGVLRIRPTDGVDGTLANLTSGAQQEWHEYCNLVTKIVMEDGVTNVPENCFNGCSNATSARISNDVIYVGINSFNGCSSLTSIILPNKISSIDQNAFKGCTGLTDIYCYASATWMGGNWFDEDGDDFKASKATKCHVFEDQLSYFLGYWGAGGSRDHLNLTFVGDLDAHLALGDGDNAGAIDEYLAEYDGKIVEELVIERPVYCNTYYNTICLPFNMNETQIANSSIAGAEIKEFVDAEISGGALNLSLSVVTTIEKGKPYFISYSMASALDRLEFAGVQVDKTDPAGVTHNGVTMQGTYHGYHMAAETEGNHSHLFLGQNNTLYWPSAAGYIKPFRCYFIIDTGSGAPIRRGMPAYLVDAVNTPTDVNIIDVDNSPVQKRIENGQLVIIRNGEKFNAQGQMMK